VPEQKKPSWQWLFWLQFDRHVVASRHVSPPAQAATVPPLEHDPFPLQVSAWVSWKPEHDCGAHWIPDVTSDVAQPLAVHA